MSPKKDPFAMASRGTPGWSGLVWPCDLPHDFRPNAILRVKSEEDDRQDVSAFYSIFATLARYALRR